MNEGEKENERLTDEDNDESAIAIEDSDVELEDIIAVEQREEKEDWAINFRWEKYHSVIS